MADGEVPNENINIVGPDGELGSVPPEQVSQYLNSPFQKYRLATDEDLTQHLEKQKYESLGERTLAGVEEAAKSGTFGLSSGLETGLSKLGASALSPEEQAKREEYNPEGAKFIESGIGLGLSTLIPGVGEANLLERAGLAGSKALGLGAEDAAAAAFKKILEEGGSKEAANIAKQKALQEFSTVAKIGSQAAKTAIETAGFQAGNEVSNLFTNQLDPNTPLQTAITNITLAGLLGGALGTGLGTVSPIWKATAGPKVGQLLKGIQDRLGGLDNKIPDAITNALETSGIDVAPEVKAGLSGIPELQNKFQILQESSSGAGMEAQQALKEFRKSAQEVLVKELGRAPEDLENLGEMSHYESGKKVQDTLHEELKKQYEPVSEIYKNIENKFNNVAINNDDQNLIGEKISKLIQDKGYYLSPSAPSAQVINKTLEELSGIQTVNDLKKYISIINEKTQNPELWKVGGDLRRIFRDSMSTILSREAGKEAPELLTAYTMAGTQYADLMNKIDSLNDRLHVGKYAGPESFLGALKDMSPEDVLRRASGKNDVDLLKLLSENFPNAANEVKNFHVDSVLKQAAQNAGDGNLLSAKKLFTALDKLSPEIKNFAYKEATPGSISNKFNSVRSLLEAVPEKMNNSGTAKTLDSLWSRVPGTALGFITMLTGHNPLLAFMMEPLSRWLSRDLPDAARLSMLRFAGAGRDISAGGFKAMADFVHHLKKGEDLINSATKNVFKAGETVLPSHLIPSQKDREKLDKQVEQLNEDNTKLIDIGGEIHHYMPEQGAAMGQLAMNALQVLSALKPNSAKLSPLDSESVTTKAQEAAYNRALDIAQQPLLALQHIKDGELVPQDVQIINQIYPDLKNRITQKLMSELSTQVEKEKHIPYKMRMGLSLFGGQPLDSTLTPQGIVAAQATFQQNLSPTQPAPEARGGRGHSMKALSKIAEIDQTPQQSRQMARSKV